MKSSILLKVLRVLMGFIFLWSFFDKTFGLGFATSAQNSWIKGGSPTYGFLTNATHGPFANFFQSLAGVAIVDWLFMLGLLFVGATFILKKFVKWGSVVGILMMLLMYLSAFPPTSNPIIDSHIIYLFIMALIAFENSHRVIHSKT